MRALRPCGLSVGQQNIPRAYRHVHLFARRGITERDLNFACAIAQPHAHDAIGLAEIKHSSAQQIFKTSGLRKALAARRFEHLHGRAAADNASVLEHDHALAQRIHFLAAVRDVQNGYALGCIPGAQIVQDRGFQRRVQSRQRLIEEQHAGLGDERSCQGDALPFPPEMEPGFCLRNFST